eukprot:2548197-Amphidinium_carterae.1
MALILAQTLDFHARSAYFAFVIARHRRSCHGQSGLCLPVRIRIAVTHGLWKSSLQANLDQLCPCIPFTSLVLAMLNFQEEVRSNLACGVTGNIECTQLWRSCWLGCFTESGWSLGSRPKKNATVVSDASTDTHST